MNHFSDGINFLKVEVIANSSQESFFWSDDSLIIKVKEKAEKGMANKRVFKILSSIYPKKRIEFIKGVNSKNKIFKIYDKK